MSETTQYASTEEITINGETRDVHYTMFALKDIQTHAEEISERLHDCNAVTIDDDTVQLTGDPPFDYERTSKLTNILWELSSISFYDYTEDVTDGQYFSIIHDYIPSGDDGWEYSKYDGQDPAVADVIATYLCLLHASKANNIFAPQGDGDSIGDFLSEERFNRDTQLGFMLALRDAFCYDAPKNPFKPAFLSNREKAIPDAVENALGVELTTDELHALLLCQRNKTNCLRSASQQGQKEIANQTMQALGDLTQGLKNLN